MPKLRSTAVDVIACLIAAFRQAEADKWWPIIKAANLKDQ